MALSAPASSSPRVARRAGGLPLIAPLAAILTLALALRLSGLGWGLPWAFHPDEIFYVDQALDILKFGDLDPKYFKNPSLLTYLIAGELLVTRALGPLAGPLAPGAAGSTYLLARLNGALFGTATVALLVPLGALLFSRRAGLLAGLLLAVAFIHVRDSHYGVNDVPGTFLLTLSLYAAARALGGAERRWLLLAGLAGGLATSTKYNMGFFFVPILAVGLLRWRRTKAGRTGLLLTLVLAGGAGAAGYLAGTPFTLFDFPRFWADFQVQYGYGNQRWLGQPLAPVPLLYLTSLLQGFGALPLAAGLIGLAQALRRQRAAAILLLAFPLVYLAFLVPKQLFFPRFVIPLLPNLCLLAAYGLPAVGARLKTRAALGLLVGLTVAQPLALSLVHNRLLFQADTRVLANEWIQANLPRGSRLKIEDYSLRDLSTQARTYTPNTADLKIERFEGSPEAEQARYFAERNVQYVVTSSFTYERYLLDPPLPGQQESGARYQRLHRSLEQRTELVARFSPGFGNAELPYRLDDVLTPFWSIEQYERPGPTIRIYLVGGG